MSLASTLVRVGLFCTALLASPSLAAAQFTLSGRVVDAIPGGGAILDPAVSIHSVAANGQTSFQTELFPCFGGATSDCIDAGGAFNATNLSNGVYKVYVYGANTLEKVLNATVSGNTNIGNVGLIRTPFDLEVTIGDIPAAGGLIPVTVRATTRWAVPAVPIIVAVNPFQESADATGFLATPQVLHLTWPAGLTDTGVVPLSQLTVSPGDPAGGYHCVDVTIRLQASPRLILGRGPEVCSRKRP